MMFDHSFNDVFGLYVNMDPSSLDDNKDLEFPSDLDQLFPVDSISNSCGDHSPAIPAPKCPSTTPQPCSKEPSCLQQETVSPTQQPGFVSHGQNHTAAISDPSLRLEASSRPAGTHRPLSVTRPTPPATPHGKKFMKDAIITPQSNRYRDPNDNSHLLGKQGFSPSLTPSSQMQKNSMAYTTDAWASRFHGFGIQPPNDRLPLSPPPSDILVQHEHIPTGNVAQVNRCGEGVPRQPAEVHPQFDSNIFTQSPAIPMPSPSADALARQHQRYFPHVGDSALPTPKPPSPDTIFSNPSDPHSIQPWHSSSLGASPFPFSPDFPGQERGWWSSPLPPRGPERQPSYQSLVATSDPASPFENTGCQSDMSQGGLMIQFEPSLGMPASSESSFSMRSAPVDHESQSFSNMDMPNGAPGFVGSSSFMTPMVHDPHPRSPSQSPKSAASPRAGQASTPIRVPYRRTNSNHSRKLSSLSSSAPKPVTGTSRSSTSPKGQHNKAVTVSFVNFTPSDSKKILTGVAPSGSSKTKARRELEARERRRKLSEAALNAVRSAGGDVEALEAVLC